LTPAFIRHIASWLLLAFTLVMVFFSCRKDDEIDTNPSLKLEFSTDTLIFDTVFTTIGTTTRYLKVYNRNDSRVRITAIDLASGSNSDFEMNVDGVSGHHFTNIEIDSDDSLFIFIRANIDPTSQNAPLVVLDSILFNLNGNLQDVDVVAWGQDAHYFVGKDYIEGFRYPYVIVAGESQNITWPADKPYVIYGYAVVDSSAVLNIEAGASIHFHKNSGLWVYRYGCFRVNGSFDQPVTFQGDRLEMDYEELPGQWDRIWINEGSLDNVINYAIIKNGFIGLQAETLVDDLGNTLFLTNSIIRNMSQWGLFTKFYRVTGANNVFANCAAQTLFLSTGGSYDFRHCTFANYWTESVRLDPSFIVSNYLVMYDDSGNPITYLGTLQKAFFGNCVIYGGLNEEVLLAKDDAVAFHYFFDHCLIRSSMDVSDPQCYNTVWKNLDPLFTDEQKNDLRPDTLSPLIDRGDPQVVTGSTLDITKDLNANSRTQDAGPDLGAYEFIPE
jgi:hypothetical protein